MATNEVDPYQTTKQLGAVFCAIALLSAPCTFGLSFVGLVGLPFGIVMGYVLLEQQVARHVDTTVSRAWSGATLLAGGVPRGGLLWVEGDELRFAGTGQPLRWKLAELDGLALEPQMMFWRGLCWGQGDERVRVSVPDPDGWMRVLSGGRG